MLRLTLGNSTKFGEKQIFRARTTDIKLEFKHLYLNYENLSAGKQS